MNARELQVKAAEAFRAGDLIAAAAALTEAARLDPAEPEYARNLAELARERGDRDDALIWMAKASDLTRAAPTVPRLNMLAASWIDAGERLKALEAASDAIALQDNPTSRALAADALRKLTTVPAQHRGLLVRAINEAWLGRDLLRPAMATLRDHWPETIEGLASDPLLGAVLAFGAVQDVVLEGRLTALRKALLGRPLSGVLAPLQAALAVQCFLNEYAWGVTLEEQEEVLRLSAQERTPERLLKLAAYLPLGDLSDAGSLLQRPWPPVMHGVLRQQLAEPAQERELANAIPSLTEIKGETSQAVRAMYEANPYPRWTRAAAPRPMPLQAAIQSQFPRVRLAPVPNAATPEILIAGCGTGSHVLHSAGRYAGARVLGVDLSRASLAYAARKTREAGLGNVNYAQADLLEMSGDFDVIEAAGSLQCMADPDAGLKALVRMLRPGGLIRLGLYSRVARAELQPARDLGANYTHTPEGIRAYRQAIINAPEGDPVRAALGSGDFYSTSNCRDLLLHVMEHQHTVSDLQRMMADNGLRFLGFIVPPEVLTRYRTSFPQDPAATDLGNWSAFEQQYQETFRTMYQFWAQRPA